jgi:DNA-binding NarL/FixJ family response regulator
MQAQQDKWRSCSEAVQLTLQAGRRFTAAKGFAEQTRWFIEYQRAFNRLMLTQRHSFQTAPSVERTRVLPSMPRPLEPVPLLTSTPGCRSLTRQQLVVASLIADGLSNREIADRLTLTPGTVANHVGNILNRLGVENRVQIAVWMTGHTRAA